MNTSCLLSRRSFGKDMAPSKRFLACRYLLLALGMFGATSARADLPGDIPSLRDGAWAKVRENGKEKTVYFSDINASLAPVAAGYCAITNSHIHNCRVSDTRDEVNTREGSIMEFNRLQVTFTYEDDSGKTRTAGPFATFVYPVRSCPVGYVLTSLYGTTYPNRDFSTANNETLCRPSPAMPSPKFLGTPDDLDATTNRCEGSNSPGRMVGNPIDAATSNKFEVVTDFASAAAPALLWQRTYNSGAFSPGLSPLDVGEVPITTHLGNRWRGSFDRSLERTQTYETADNAYHPALYLRREDGKSVLFREQAIAMLGISTKTVVSSRSRWNRVVVGAIYAAINRWSSSQQMACLSAVLMLTAM
jgi:hypothetical protein